VNGPISTLPTGLLSLLGIQNSGKYPQELDQVLRTHLDQLPWLTTRADTQLSTSLPGQATGTQGDLFFGTVRTPNPGKMWLVRGVQVYWQVVATDVAVFRATAMAYLAGDYYPIAMGDWDGFQAGLTAPGGAAISFCSSWLKGPFLMRNGDYVMAQCKQLATVAGQQIFCRLQYLEF
jgi:hypothetical protein